MSLERLKRAVFAAEVRRKGTLLSDEAVADVCEALLQLVEEAEGTITLELHERLLREAVERKRLRDDLADAGERRDWNMANELEAKLDGGGEG